MGELNTQIIYSIEDNWKKWFSLRHTFGRMYLKTILDVQYRQMRLHDDDNYVM